MALAALQSVTLAYLAGDGDAIPLWRMAATPVSVLRQRAEVLAAQVPGAKVIDTEAVAGGGSLPGLTIPSTGLSLEVPDADAAVSVLRSVGIVARVDAGAIVCDLRTVDPSDDTRLATALAGLAS
jgi:L-seryl-tRNA(Ser) seleniumtransferase